MLEIGKTLAGIRPGRIYQREWRGFGDAKTYALACAQKELGDSAAEGYALVLDADEILSGELPEDLTLDRYHVWYQINNVRFTTARLFRMNRVWTYLGVLHEFSAAQENCTEAILKLTLTTPRDGARSKNPNKYAEDAEILEAEILRMTTFHGHGPTSPDPQGLESVGDIDSRHGQYPLLCRYVFYLAQSYRDSGQPRKAAENYLKRARMGGGFNWEEIYCALLEAGRMFERLNEQEEADRTYLRAHHQWPDRAEALRILAYRMKSRLALSEAKQPVGTLFVESNAGYRPPRVRGASAGASPYRLIYQGLNDCYEMLVAAQTASVRRPRNASEWLMELLFYNHKGLPTDKWHHFLAVYDRHLHKLSVEGDQTCPPKLLEIGVQGGGSLQIWKQYLGPDSIVHGLDIDESCGRPPEATVHIGDQTDEKLLQQIVREMGGLDIVIDDGSHVNHQQIKTFEVLFPLLSENGVYICEDTHTSYWPAYGGGNQHAGSFVEHAKELVDKLHAWYVVDGDGDQDETFARMTDSVSFYDSIVVIQKRKRSEPKRSLMGSKEEKKE
jgi:tetratricopeptide (TPR) repeat protein